MIGLSEGDEVATTVERVGESVVGFLVGASVGDVEGLFVGAAFGFMVGRLVGLTVGGSDPRAMQCSSINHGNLQHSSSVS